MRGAPARERTREEILAGLPQIAPGLYAASVQWLSGTNPGGNTFKHEVRDPPCNGWGTCLVLDRDVDERGKSVKLVTLFAMSWFDSWQVSRKSLEYQGLVHQDDYKLRKGLVNSAECEDRIRAYYKEAFPRFWAQIINHGWQKDFANAAAIMRKLDLPVPVIEEVEGVELKTSGGKEVSQVGLTKPVKRNSRKGQVLAAFWPETKAILEVMAELGITNNNVLSQLFLLRKDHGIGYELRGGAAHITMPDGCNNPWADEGNDAAFAAQAEAALG